MAEEAPPAPEHKPEAALDGVAHEIEPPHAPTAEAEAPAPEAHIEGEKLDAPKAEPEAHAPIEESEPPPFPSLSTPSAESDRLERPPVMTGPTTWPSMPLRGP